MHHHPVIIQGGMGAGVSSWRLAQAVSRLGQLGVVSGTALDQILIRRLQDGDPDGHMRRGLAAFPFPDMAQRILRAYFIPGGKAATAPYRTIPSHTQNDPRELTELLIAANFVEVFLAREGHDHPVGINYLEKVQIPHLPSLYGAMLAGVGYVLMGAGIPLQVPGVLDRLAEHQPADYPLHITGAREGENTVMHFNPRDYWESDTAPSPSPPTRLSRHRLLQHPRHHHASPSQRPRRWLRHRNPHRRRPQRPAPRQAPAHSAGRAHLRRTRRHRLRKIRDLGAPFWLAGGYGSASKLQEALALGATGVQVGTAFAFTRESGLRDDLKQALLDKARSGDAQVFTDPLASPAGFPFKVAQLEGTASDDAVCAARPRICDLGFLSEIVRAEDGTLIHRCPAEPLSLYLSKGGKAEDAAGRKCLCNALMANIGHQQVRCGSHVEPPSSPPATTSPKSPASSPIPPQPTAPPTSSTPCSPPEPARPPRRTHVGLAASLAFLL